MHKDKVNLFNGKKKRHHSDGVKLFMFENITQ
jgi:hypothetical protein